MKLKRISAWACVAMLLASPAMADVSAPAKTNVTVTSLTPTAYTSTSSAVTVATALTFQQVFAANGSRHDCHVQNTSSDVEYVFLGATVSATTGASFQLNPGDTFNCTGPGGVATDAVQITSASLNGATAAAVTQ